MPASEEVMRREVVAEVVKKIDEHRERSDQDLKDTLKRYMSPRASYGPNSIANPQDNVAFTSPANGSYDTSGLNPVVTVACQLLFEDQTGAPQSSPPAPATLIPSTSTWTMNVNPPIQNWRYLFSVKFIRRDGTYEIHDVFLKWGNPQ
jgi:hypothetical protein